MGSEKNGMNLSTLFSVVPSPFQIDLRYFIGLDSVLFLEPLQAPS